MMVSDRLGPYILGPDGDNVGVYTGDARVLAKDIPGESVDLIFSDPIYQNVDDYHWLAETAARILKDGGDLLAYCSQYHLARVLSVMTPYLNYRWLNIEKKKMSGMLWEYRLMFNCVALLWFTKGKPRRGPRRTDFHFLKPAGDQVNHKWAKSTDRAIWWLSRFGLPGDIVLDPFAGGGSIPAACKVLQRQWLGFEIVSDIAETARQRIRDTQPPLFCLQSEQLAMEV